MTEAEQKEKYWIEPGMFVQEGHLKGPILTVMRIVKTRKKGERGKPKTFVKGVECYWIDHLSGARKTAIFHTKALVKYEPTGASV